MQSVHYPDQFVCSATPTGLVCHLMHPDQHVYIGMGQNLRMKLMSMEHAMGSMQGLVPACMCDCTHAFISFILSVVIISLTQLHWTCLSHGLNSTASAHGFLSCRHILITWRCAWRTTLACLHGANLLAETCSPCDHGFLILLAQPVPTVLQLTSCLTRPHLPVIFPARHSVQAYQRN